MLKMENEIFAPDSSEADLAKATGRYLASRVGGAGGSPLEIQDRDNGVSLPLPAATVKVLLQVLSEHAQGHAVTVNPVQEELSTQEAAELLNVSRPYVVKLVDDGEIPSREVGGQRRFRLRDVIGYKQKMYGRQMDAANELTALSQEMGLYDIKPR